MITRNYVFHQIEKLNNTKCNSQLKAPSGVSLTHFYLKRNNLKKCSPNFVSKFTHSNSVSRNLIIILKFVCHWTVKVTSLLFLNNFFQEKKKTYLSMFIVIISHPTNLFHISDFSLRKYTCKITRIFFKWIVKYDFIC